MIWQLYLFYNNYKKVRTTYINHARWHRGLHKHNLIYLKQLIYRPVAEIIIIIV